MLIIGESVLKLDDYSKLRQGKEAVEAARQTTSKPIIPMVVTHYARPGVLSKAQQDDILVVQSFEWEVLEPVDL